jgi:hypothetical protein
MSSTRPETDPVDPGRTDGWIVVAGILQRGHRVASGPSQDYPYGSLERQFPLFKGRGLDLDGFFQGTLNVSIAPHAWVWIRPTYTFRAVRWTDRHPPEDFSFAACRVRFKEVEYAGWVYYPHPETKIRNFQDPALIEAIAEEIPGITYGEPLVLMLDPAAIRIR